MKKLLVFLLVLSCLCVAVFAAEAKTADQAMAKWTDGTETFEGTLPECMAKVNEKGGTLTLLDDVTGPGEFATTRNDIDDADYIIGATKAFTLDLNGHTLTAPTTGAIYVNPGEEGGIFVLKNGTVTTEGAEALYIANAGLQVLNTEMWTTKAQTISFYETTGKYNKDNLIEGSSIGTTIWYAISFNNTKASQEKASITVINSTLAGLRGKGYAPIGLQGKAKSGNVVYGEGVTLYSYGVKHTATALKTFGEPLTMAAEQSITYRGEAYDMVNVWTTPAKPSVDISAMIPGDGEATMENSPALRKVTLTPVEEQQKEEAPKEEDKAPEAPAEEKSSSTGIIIAIIAAVAVVAVIVIVAAKKKK